MSTKQFRAVSCIGSVCQHLAHVVSIANTSSLLGLAHARLSNVQKSGWLLCAVGTWGRRDAMDVRDVGDVGM